MKLVVDRWLPNRYDTIHFRYNNEAWPDGRGDMRPSRIQIYSRNSTLCLH